MRRHSGRRRVWQLPAALLLAALAVVGSVVFGPPSDGPPTVPPGVFVLLVAAAAGWLVCGRSGGVLVLVLIACLIVVSFPQFSADLVGDRGLAVGVLRGVEVVCLGVAVFAAARRVRRRSTDPGRPDFNGKAVQVVAVLGLCAIGAELLAAYDDSTGDPEALAFALIFFAALYGAPALLARELVRRRGWGWPSLLLLFAALGTAQACVIDQSMFAVDYQGYEGWELFREQTLIPALGISASNAYSFVIGHVVYSFAAPVALAEAWAPRRAREPWLPPAGIVAAALAYLGAAAVILADPESHTGSRVQLAVSCCVVVAFVAAALLVGRARATTPKAGGPPVWAVLLITLVVALAPDLVNATTWRGLAVGVVASGALGIAILVAARVWGWSLRHSAAAGLGFLLVRGLMAFTYFPLTGDVEPFAKYAHNTAMLLVVLIAGAAALRREPDRQGALGRRGRPDPCGRESSMPGRASP